MAALTSNENETLVLWVGCLALWSFFWNWQLFDWQVGCTVVAAFLHYLLLAMFSWMLCEGVLLYILLVKVFGGGAEDKVKYFYIFGWGKYGFVLSPIRRCQTWQTSKLLPKSILILFKIDFAGFPAIIVVTSLAATRAVGYGKIAHACWLDVHSGLIWAFIAPALTIILVSENSSTLSYSVRSMNLKCFVPKSSMKRKSTNSFHSFI